MGSITRVVVEFCALRRIMSEGDGDARLAMPAAQRPPNSEQRARMAVDCSVECNAKIRRRGGERQQKKFSYARYPRLPRTVPPFVRNYITLVWQAAD
jgi:hypothetical protein